MKRGKCTTNRVPSRTCLVSDDSLQSDSFGFGIDTFAGMFNNVQKSLGTLGSLQPKICKKSKKVKSTKNANNSTQAQKDPDIAVTVFSEDEIQSSSTFSSSSVNSNKRSNSRGRSRGRPRKDQTPKENGRSGMQEAGTSANRRGRNTIKRTPRGRGSGGKSSRGRKSIEILDVSEDEAAKNWRSDAALLISPALENQDTCPFTVRITWKSDVLRLKMLETDSCYELRIKLAKQVNLKPSDVMIFFDDVSKIFDDRESLKDAGIVLGTILEASQRPITSSTTTSTVLPSTIPSHPSTIRIKIQSIEKRSEVYLETKKTSPLRELQVLYAIKMDLSPNQVKFKFDGDTVNLDNTPNDLDLEGDECFDVIIS